MWLKMVPTQGMVGAPSGTVAEVGMVGSESELYRVDVPPGAAGDWAIRRYRIGERAARVARLQAAIDGHGRYVPSGVYTGLFHRGTLVMSDTPDEIRDQLPFIGRARGRVLIHGLGLGLSVQAALAKTEVAHVLVVERADEVIALVAPHYRRRFGDDRLEIRRGDALTWGIPPDAWWDCVWHDIWATISPANLSEMTRLHDRFAGRCDWQESWGRTLLTAGDARPTGAPG